jgi:hypothetical protein
LVGGGMNQMALELVTRDVFLYITKAGVRDEIDAVVAAKLTEQPTVVVGHSLGAWLRTAYCGAPIAGRASRSS